MPSSQVATAFGSSDTRVGCIPAVLPGVRHIDLVAIERLPIRRGRDLVLAADSGTDDHRLGKLIEKLAEWIRVL